MEQFDRNFLYSAGFFPICQPWRSLKAVQSPSFLFYFLLRCCCSGCCHESRLSWNSSGFFLLLISTITCKISSLAAAQVSFSSFDKIINPKKVHRLINWSSCQVSASIASFYRFFFVLFSVCVQGAHYSCLALCSSPISLISHVILRSTFLLRLTVQSLHFSMLAFFRLFSGFISLSLLYSLPCGLISVFRPFLASQTARARLTKSLHCPQEGFLTASREPHISNW